MFHLLRQCFQIPSKVVYHQRLQQMGRSDIIYSACPFKWGRPKLQLLRQSPASIHKAQDFHSSGCSWKKKQPPELEVKSMHLIQSGMKSLKESPKPALYLGFAGLIPFVSIPLIMAIQKVAYPELAFAQIAYGASILSFLGGVRWGFALPEGSPDKPDWTHLAISISSPFIAWSTLLLKSASEAAVTIIFGLGIALHYDLAFIPTYPRWFKILRTILTVVAVGSLFATVYIVETYPKKPLSSIVELNVNK